MVPVPGVSGGKGVGRSASGQLRHPGIAAPLCHSDGFIRTGHGGRTARRQTGEGQRHRAALGQGGRGRREGQAGRELVDGHQYIAGGLRIVLTVHGRKDHVLCAAVGHGGKLLPASKAPSSGDGDPFRHRCAPDGCVWDRLTVIDDCDGVDGQVGHKLILHSDGNSQAKTVVIGGFHYGNGDRAGFAHLFLLVHQLISQYGAVHSGRIHKNPVIIRHSDSPQHIPCRKQVLQIKGLGYAKSALAAAGCVSGVAGL